MNVERVSTTPPSSPFPIYENLVDSMLRAHAGVTDDRDAAVAHALAMCAGYAYADTKTFAMMMSRLGLEGHCVRVTQVVDAMYIYSTAYLLQSRSGRVVILSYRGTEPGNIGNWLGDAEIGSDSMIFGREQLQVHSGFYRSVRATRLQVLDELQAAAEGKSLLDHQTRAEHPMEALYVTGHSLGGAMAVLFALSILDEKHRSIVDRLRAIYTFGQPLVAADPLPRAAELIARRLFRHINAADIVPVLPAIPWGPLAHFGHEYRYSDGEWRQSDTPLAQLTNLREIPASLITFVARARGRNPPRYSTSAHGPHHYIAALRPPGRITEFGD